jgi:hypothetical protein
MNKSTKAIVLITIAAASAFGIASPVGSAEAASGSMKARAVPFDQTGVDSLPQHFATPEAQAAQQAIYDDQYKQVREYEIANPEDLVGAEALMNRLYGGKLQISLNGIDRLLSAAEAQAIMVKRATTPVGAQRRVAPAAAAAPAAVPVNAFSVAFMFQVVPSTTEYTWGAYGTWNFRDDYVNGSAPDDIAANRLTTECMRIGTTEVFTYDYTGAQTHQGYLLDAGLNTNSPIVGVRDTVSGFVMGADHGTVYTPVWVGCGPAVIQGQFTYEHNQDGGAVASVSAGFGGFGVSYSGGSIALQQSSGVVDFG